MGVPLGRPMEMVLRLLALLNQHATYREIPSHLRGEHAVAVTGAKGDESYFAVQVDARHLQVCDDHWSEPVPLCIDGDALARIFAGETTRSATFHPAGHPLLSLIEHLLGSSDSRRP